MASLATFSLFDKIKPWLPFRADWDQLPCSIGSVESRNCPERGLFALTGAFWSKSPFAKSPCRFPDNCQ